jgi:Ca-activated chloride channel family protein
MSFERPLLLAALLLVPLAAAVYLLAQRRSARYAVRYSNLDVLAAAAAGQQSWRRHLPAALLGLALATLAVALARPHFTRMALVEQATVVLVVDVSRSMQSQDVKPSRLAAAKAAARTFMDQVPKRLRVGLVVFSGDVTVSAVPTLDHALVRQSIDAIGPYSGFGGTAIGDAVARAVELGRDSVSGGLELQSVEPTRAPADVARGVVSVLFLSDGRQNRGILLPAEGAQRAKQAGIPVYTVALGNPDADSSNLGGQQGFGFGGGFRAPDPATLRAIARTTGGEFFEARSSEALGSAYEDLGSRHGRAPPRSALTFAIVAAAAGVLAAAGLLSPFFWPRLP